VICTPAYRDAVTRKADLITNLTLSIFPSVRIELYNRGSKSRTDSWIRYCQPHNESAPHSVPNPCNVTEDRIWARSSRYTLDERGDSFGVSLYRLPEIWCGKVKTRVA
jgi:hypothetical protein